MAGPEDYDLAVLGSGEAGKILAWTLSSEGKQAAVIERKCLGGSCPHIPTAGALRASDRHRL